MQHLKELKQWIVWKDERSTKVPYNTDGTHASTTDPRTWDWYDAAVKTAASDKYTGYGFVLTKESQILFIDLDKCLDQLPQHFAELIAEADTYTEISPSGNGLHLLLRLTEPLHLVANRSSKCPGFECYTMGRYTTITEKVYKEYDTIRTVTPEEAVELLKSVGYPWKKEKKDAPPPTATTTSSLSTHELLERMFSSKNGAKIKKLYNGDTSAYQNDPSAADMALCSHLAFWFQKDSDRIKEVWTASPLGQREKTQKRPDYVDRTVAHAVQECDETYEAPEDTNRKTIQDTILNETGQDIELHTNNKGIPYVSQYNIELLMAADPQLRDAFRFNTFAQVEETRFTEQKWTELQHQHFLAVTSYIQRTYPFFEKVPKNVVEQGVVSHLHQHKHNEPRTYLRSRVWDHRPRLDDWLTVVFGCPSDEYHAAVGSNWMKGLVKRVLYPGSKFDTVLVLEGPQGYKKTTALHTLGRGYHVETTLDATSKDFYMLLMKNVIVEFSEGETLSRSELKALKAIITMQEDQVRLPYARTTTRHPRHCVFAMTTNQSQYLKDETGNRRWLPVSVEKIADTKWLEENLDQLYAEAVYRIEEKHETTWEYPEEALRLQQEARLEDNPYQEEIVEWYLSLTKEERYHGITTKGAYEAMYGGLNKDIHTGHLKLIASILQNELLLDRRRSMVEGSRTYRYYPSPKTIERFGEGMTEVEKKAVETQDAYERSTW